MAANINSGKNISITAGDDVNIQTLKKRNRSERRWGSKKRRGLGIIDNTDNISSNIVSAGAISLTANGSGPDGETSGANRGSNITITGSNPLRRIIYY